MSDESNRDGKPVANPNTGGTNDTATGRGPQRPDNEPQVAVDGSTAPDGDARPADDQDGSRSTTTAVP